MNGKLGLTAVGTGILSSSCCVLPLIFAFTSLGGGTLSALYGEYNTFLTGYLSPILMIATFLLLGFAFYLAYFKKNKACDIKSGSCPTRGSTRGVKVILWVSMVISLVFSLFPYYSEYILPV